MDIGTITQSLPELFDQLALGDEVVLTRNQQTVARLKGEAAVSSTPLKPRPGPGFMKGSILYMAPDFDEPLEDMKEYME